MRILPARGDKFGPLERGPRLGVGDVLAAGPESRLRVRAGDRTFATPKAACLPAGAAASSTSSKSRARRPFPRRPPKGWPKVPERSLRLAREADWLKFGEAGAPTIPGQVQAPLRGGEKGRDPG